MEKAGCGAGVRDKRKARGPVFRDPVLVARPFADFSQPRKKPSATGHQCFHWLPWLQRLSSPRAEFEPAPTPFGSLVKSAVNPDTRQRAEKQSADAAMPDEKNIPRLRTGKTGINFGHDATLRIFRRFPPAHASAWLSEKLVRNGFEFVRWQKARCAAIIFMHPGPHLQRYPQRFCKWRGGFERFRLVTGDHPTGCRKGSELPSQGSNTFSAYSTQ